MSDQPSPRDALAAARAAQSRADDASIWWYRVDDHLSTHVLRKDGSWAVYAVVPDGEELSCVQVSAGRD